MPPAPQAANQFNSSSYPSAVCRVGAEGSAGGSVLNRFVRPNAAVMPLIVRRRLLTRNGQVASRHYALVMAKPKHDTQTGKPRQ